MLYKQVYWDRTLKCRFADYSHSELLYLSHTQNRADRTTGSNVLSFRQHGYDVLFAILRAIA